MYWSVKWVGWALAIGDRISAVLPNGSLDLCQGQRVGSAGRRELLRLSITIWECCLVGIVCPLDLLYSIFTPDVPSDQG